MFRKEKYLEREPHYHRLSLTADSDFRGVIIERNRSFSECGELTEAEDNCSRDDARFSRRPATPPPGRKSSCRLDSSRFNLRLG